MSGSGAQRRHREPDREGLGVWAGSCTPGASPARRRPRCRTARRCRRPSGGPRGCPRAGAGAARSMVVGTASRTNSARPRAGLSRNGASAASAVLGVESTSARPVTSRTGVGRDRRCRSWSARRSRRCPRRRCASRAARSSPRRSPSRSKACTVCAKCCGARQRAEVEAGDDAEEARAGAARGPEEVGVLGLATARTSSPSAVTTSMATTCSAAQPQPRAFQP